MKNNVSKKQRNLGQFYTPTLFVDYAHKMISEALGDDWKDQYVVWDNCCGTKNLTRDYRFKELYCSTLEEAELEIGKKYNPEAVSFQYDFLNDDLEKLPKGLLEAFEQNKPLVFLLNPPYGRAGKNEAGNGNMGIEKGSALTMINEKMKNDKMGHCSSNLYAQFLYRILIFKQQFNLTNCYIALFCRPGFMASGSYKLFRNIFLQHFEYNNGILFNASNFGNVSSSWGIIFNIWKCGKQKDLNNFIHNIVCEDDNKIKYIGNKIIYNTDNTLSMNKWLKEKRPNLNIIMPTFKNPITPTGNMIKWNSESIGGLYNHCNDVIHNTLYVNLWSVGGEDIITEENFEKAITIFSARKLIVNNWINAIDEYMIPNINHNKWSEFVNASIVFSIFNFGSYQTSYNNVKNEFFWMSKSEIELLANEYNNDDCYNDAHTSPERFVYKKLQEIELTPEAQAVLDKACDIVRKTFKYRELFNEDHPEYQINNWDCGWYQIKALAKEYAKDDLEEFKKLYKALADKMRPMVYELGFLK